MVDELEQPGSEACGIGQVDEVTIAHPLLELDVRQPLETLALRRDDFVYADPPYDVEFTQYAQGGFSWEDQERTAVFLAKHPGPVILVNQATRRIKELYRDLGYRTRILEAPRRISCNGDRTPAKEILATKNL